MINKRKSQSGKFASVSLVLTVLAVVAVIVFNVSLSLLATRYEWLYPKLYREHGFSVSEECRDYLRKGWKKHEDRRITPEDLNTLGKAPEENRELISWI